MQLPIFTAFSQAHIPCTGERSTLPMVLGFLAIAAVLIIIMLVLRRKNKG